MHVLQNIKLHTGSLIDWLFNFTAGSMGVGEDVSKYEAATAADTVATVPTVREPTPPELITSRTYSILQGRVQK